MSIVPWKPLDELTTLRRDLDSLWDRVSPEKPFHERFTTQEWLPSIDLTKTKDKFLVKAELPDLKAKDVELTITDDILTIKGEKRKRKKKKMSIISLWNVTQEPFNGRSNFQPISKQTKLMRSLTRGF